MATKLRLTFSLRLLLLGAGFTCIPMLFVGLHLQSARSQGSAVQRLQRDGWNITYDNFQERLTALNTNEPLEPALLRSLLGDDFFDSVVRVRWQSDSITASEIETLARLTPRLPGLSLVDLDWSNLDDRSIEPLSKSKNIKVLGIAYTDVTAAGIESLQNVSSLKILDIRGCSVSGRELSVFSKFESLQEIIVCSTQLTENDARHVRSVLPPSCTITLVDCELQ